MNIAFFVSAFPTVTETFILNQIVALKKCGHTVHIYSMQRVTGIPIHTKIIDEGLLEQTFYIDQIPGSRIGKILCLVRKVIRNLSSDYTTAFIRSVFRNISSLSVYDYIPYLDKTSYDIVHAHFGVNGNYVAQLMNLGLFRGAKFITTFHGYDLNENLKLSDYYKDLFTVCKRFTVNSGYSKERLIHLGCPPGYISLLPAGLNIAQFTRGKKVTTNAKINKLLFVGRLIALKGPDVFVEICHMLNKDSKIAFHATIIGDGPMFADLKTLISQYALEDMVTLAGSRRQEEIIAAMENATIFVLPGVTIHGLAEAQGLVIQEAQAMQLPVLISGAGGMAEGMINNVTGFVINEHNIMGFVEKIKLLALYPALRKNMGEAGRKFVAERYDMFKLNETLLSFYSVNSAKLS